jgi:hypothetical protein
MKYKLCCIAAAVLVLGACVSVSPSLNPGRVSDLVDLINTADPAAIADQSHQPFLFTDELVARRADIEMIWATFHDADLLFAEEGETIPAQPGDYLRIADTFDLEVFFSPNGYLPPDATWVPVATSAGSFDLLIGGSLNRLPVIYGIVGADR